jgi:hypothetical protein
MSADENIQDPARSYERAQPDKESGMGRLDNNMRATPTESPDRMEQAVDNAHPPRQLNAEETVDDRASAQPGEPGLPPQPGKAGLPPQPDHSMHDEEPNGWDQAPTDIHDPKMQRHPRREGKGGTP